MKRSTFFLFAGVLCAWASAACVRGGYQDNTEAGAEPLADHGPPDVTGEVDMPASDARPPISCPDGYVAVPALPGYMPTDFCVMKYEASAQRTTDQAIYAWGCSLDEDATTGDATCTDVAANWHTLLSSPVAAAALAEGRPWRRLDRAAAIQACQALGPKYDLITNDEWQAVARNIEDVASNWKEGKVGGVSTGHGGTDDNLLNHGHSAISPDEPLAASMDDDAGCFGEGPLVEPEADGSCPGRWHLEKRTHHLSWGGVIWDFAGNLWEWVKDDNSDDYDGVDVFLSHVTASSHPSEYSLSGGTTTTPRNARDQFGPAGDHTSFTTPLDYGGLGKAFFNAIGGGVIRSGRHAAERNSGVFYVRLINGPGAAYSFLGFRCVYHP